MFSKKFNALVERYKKDGNVDINEGWNIITKNKTECSIVKYFDHLMKPDITNDISQKKLKKVNVQYKLKLIHLLQQ